MTWGIIPAAGIGSRIQPLAFSKELLPVGGRRDGEIERPKAVSEYLVERMVRGGANKICFVVAPGKSDIMEYYGARVREVPVVYVVQREPVGLCDAIFQSLPLVRDDEFVLVGLPDTVWFPEDALAALGDDDLSFLCFPVERPEVFDAVVTDEHDRVIDVRVKQREVVSNWIWGAFKLRGRTFRALHQLWEERRREDAYVGTLVNAWLAKGGVARAVRAGRAYVDVGTLEGYRDAVRILDGKGEPAMPRALGEAASEADGGARGGATVAAPAHGAAEGRAFRGDAEE